MRIDGLSPLSFGTKVWPPVDSRTPIQIWKRPKRGTLPGSPCVHYMLFLASGRCWHSTPEFTGICSVDEAMAGFDHYEFEVIPEHFLNDALRRLLAQLSMASHWSANDNCQHKVNWIAYGKKVSPTYNGWVLAGSIAAAIGLSQMEG